MMKKRYARMFLIMLGIAIGLSGCKLVREVDTNEVVIKNKENEDTQTEYKMITPGTIVVEDGEAIDLEAVLEYFYGSNSQSLQVQGYAENNEFVFDCVKNGTELTYVYEKEMNRNWFSAGDMTEGRAACYTALLDSKYMLDVVAEKILELFPEGELEACSKEEVIAACQPLAEACGYGEAQINVYAMTEECLQTASRRIFSNVISAPNPDYEYVSQKEICELRENGEDELADQLSDQRYGYLEWGIEWTQEHEAYFLVYQNLINGLPLDTAYYCLKCIYVPKYEKVVWAEAGMPFVMTEIQEEDELLTQDEAISEAMRILNIEDTSDITIQRVYQVYAPRYSQVGTVAEVKTINPCWRIDYDLSEETIQRGGFANDDGTILINAVDGKENSYTSMT